MFAWYALSSTMLCFLVEQVQFSTARVSPQRLLAAAIFSVRRIQRMDGVSASGVTWLCYRERGDFFEPYCCDFTPDDDA